MSRKEATAAEKPGTSEAVKRMSKVCGSSSGEVLCGAVPEKDRPLGSKVIHDGKGVLLAQIA